MFLEKIGVRIVVELIKSCWANLKSLYNSEISNYEQELNKIILLTKQDFQLKVPLTSENGEIPFYNSMVLQEAIKNALKVKPVPLEIDKLKKELEGNERISSVKIEHLQYYVELLQENVIKKNKIDKFKLKDNFEIAIFEILKIVEKSHEEYKDLFKELDSALHAEFRAELNSIKLQMDKQMWRTADELLQNLSPRIKNSKAYSAEIESNYLFLEGKCKMALGEVENGAAQIIHSYQLDPKNERMSEVALCYFYIRENDKALELAEKRIKIDFCDGLAWFVKLLTCPDEYKNILMTVPKIVKERQNFILKVTSHLYKKQISYLEIEELGIIMPKTLTEDIKKNIWSYEYYIEYSLNSYFNTEKFYLSDNGVQFNLDKEKLTQIHINILDIIHRYSHTQYPFEINHIKFYKCFISFLLSYEDFSFEEFEKYYLLLKDSFYIYDVQFSSYLASVKGSEVAYKILEDSKFKSNTINIIQRISFKYSSGDKETLKCLLVEFVESLKVIDFNYLLMIENFHLKFKDEDEFLSNQFSNILKEKKFESEEIKHLYAIMVETVFDFNSIDKNHRIIILDLILKNHRENENISLFIAKLYVKLNQLERGIFAVQNFADTQSQNPFNFLYIQLFIQLNKGIQPILTMLKNIRISNELNNYSFLMAEYPLRRKINDFEELKDILFRLIVQFNVHESVHPEYVHYLYETESYDEFENYMSKYYLFHFEDERNGVNMSHLLKKLQRKKEALDLLYELAQNPENKLARANFVGFLDYPDAYMMYYDEVIVDSYVLLIDDNEKIKLIDPHKANEINLIGKKLLETIQIPHKITKVPITYSIKSIMNKQRYIFNSILEEAERDETDIPIENINFGKKDGTLDIEKMTKFLLSRSPDNEERSKYIDSQIEAYKKREINFIEICASVQNNNLWNTYHYLTSNPQIGFKNQIPINSEPLKDNIAIDFTTLKFFSDLEKEKEISFDKKFIISSTLYSILKNDQINEVESLKSPLSLYIMNGEVIPIFNDKDFKNKITEDYTRLLDFIKCKCDKITVIEKAELLNQYDVSHTLNPLMHYLIDNSIIANKPNNLLITLDSSSLKLFPADTINVIHPVDYLRMILVDHEFEKVLQYCKEKNIEIKHGI